jgi:Uma2 family endonuclease
MATIPEHPHIPGAAEPAWDVALLFPSQGDWSEFEYLSLETNRLVELVDGNLDVLPMPSFLHQQLVWYLAEILRAFVQARQLGSVVFAPMPIHIRHRTFREPDVMFIPKKQDVKPTDRFLHDAGLIMEVVSADDKSHKRDYLEKRSDYAELGVPEYWIVDPQTERITVLVLAGNQYRVHGEFAPGQQATSNLLDGFSVDVAAVFAAGARVP